MHLIWLWEASKTETGCEVEVVEVGGLEKFECVGRLRGEMLCTSGSSCQLHQPLSPAARLVSQVGGRLENASISRAVSQPRHVRPFPPGQLFLFLRRAG